MRLVLLPTLSIADYKRDSDFYWFHKFAKVCVENGDFVYFLLPEESKEYFEKDEPGIKYLFFKDVPGFYYRMKHIPPQLVEWFSHGDGYYFADALITSRNVVAPAISSMLADRFEKRFPVFNFENIVRDGFNVGMSKIQQSLCYAQLPNWFCSSNEMYKARSMIRESMIERENNDIELYCGVDVEKLKKLTSDKKFPDFTVFFGGRINDDKNFEVIAKVMEYLYHRGSKIKFIVTTPHDRRGFIDQFLDRLKFVEFHFDTPRELFYELVAKSHVFLCASKRESYSLGFTEQLYLAGLGVFPNDGWATSVYGDNAFYASGVEEFGSMILDIQKNYDRYASQIPTVRKNLHETHDESQNYQKVYEWVVDTIPKYTAEKYSSKDDLVRTVAMMNDEFNFRTFLMNLPPMLSGIAQGGGRMGIMGYSPYGLYRMMINSKLMIDDYKSAEPIMRKIK